MAATFILQGALDRMAHADAAGAAAATREGTV